MLTLLVLRHGKAAPEAGGSDHDRTLTKRGRREAELVGNLLREAALLPDRVLSSSAERARDTAERALSAAGLETEIDVLESLYLAEPEAYVAALRDRAGSAQRVLVVGHNPGLEALSLLLTGEPRSLPTAGLVVCELQLSAFSELSLQVRGKMTRFFAPAADGD
jgi:phosphohistidine phosphatase